MTRSLTRASRRGCVVHMLLRPIVTTAAAVLIALGVTACAGSVERVPVAEVRLHGSVVLSEVRPSLPMTVMFNNRMGAAEVAYLPEPLRLEEGSVVHSFEAGDVAYWPAEQSIVIFLRAGSGAVSDERLLHIGHLTAGFADVADCAQNCAVTLTASRSHRHPRHQRRCGHGLRVARPTRTLLPFHCDVRI